MHDCDESICELCNWLLAYEECRSFFINHAQFSRQVQFIADLANAPLPFQRQYCHQTRMSSYPKSEPWNNTGFTENELSVCLATYVRSLIIYGHDSPPILRLFFGDLWRIGIGNILNSERSKYICVQNIIIDRRASMVDDDRREGQDGGGK
jgi:hypothetical protein